VSLVLPLNTLKTCLHYMLCGYKKESGTECMDSPPNAELFKKRISSPENLLYNDISANFPVSEVVTYLPSHANLDN